jgi:hypothetical protein
LPGPTPTAGTPAARGAPSGATVYRSGSAARGQLLATLVTDHRFELTLAGVATLVVVTLAHLVSVT